jgi:hypothetical protein
MAKSTRATEDPFDDDDATDEALRLATLDARRFHKALGNPMATWADGKVVWVAAEEIDTESADPGRS